MVCRVMAIPTSAPTSLILVHPCCLPARRYGNGTGEASGIRGTVASASSFGNGVAVPPAGGTGASRGTVQAGGFATAAVGTEAPKAKQAETVAAVQPVEILFKPSPQYTDEARKLGIEGEVLVSVVFPASGPVRVVSVVKGLGHGLDEAALRAAQQIRFKPALQNGTPVDFPATVHIVFSKSRFKHFGVFCAKPLGHTLYVVRERAWVEGGKRMLALKLKWMPAAIALILLATVKTVPAGSQPLAQKPRVQTQPQSAPFTSARQGSAGRGRGQDHRPRKRRNAHHSPILAAG